MFFDISNHSSVIPSVTACRAVALCEGWEESRCESVKVTSTAALRPRATWECFGGFKLWICQNEEHRPQVCAPHRSVTCVPALGMTRTFRPL
jgi:hypothetical protein